MHLEKIHTCTGHRAAIYALVWEEPDTILTAAGDGWLVEWSLAAPETGRLTASVDTPVYTLCRLPDSRLVAGNMNGGIHWIDRNRPEAGRNIQHHQKGVYDLLYLNGFVFSAGGDGFVTKWSAQESRSLESLQLSTQALRCLAYSPENNLLALGSSDSNIYFLEADSLTLVHTIRQAHTNSVFTLAFSPEGQLLFSGGRDAQVRVWQAYPPFESVETVPAHLFTVNHLVFSPDGKRFATASRDKTFKLWETETRRLLKVVDTIRYGGHINSVNRLLWRPEALFSCSDDSTMSIWKITEY